MHALRAPLDGRDLLAAAGGVVLAALGGLAIAAPGAALGPVHGGRGRRAIFSCCLP